VAGLREPGSRQRALDPGGQPRSAARWVSGQRTLSQADGYPVLPTQLPHRLDDV